MAEVGDQDPEEDEEEDDVLEEIEQHYEDDGNETGNQNGNEIARVNQPSHMDDSSDLTEFEASSIISQKAGKSKYRITIYYL